ncbi:MAG: molecular chaperone HtpG [Alphaproteobacteria bacterium]
MSKIKFKAEVQKLLNIVVNSLYSEKQIFLRELVSNASDACDKLKYMALINPELKGPKGGFKIVIKADEKEKTLTISDNGIGMNKDDLINHLGTIAKSGTADFVANASENSSTVDLIGQFGVGFYSAFMVANKVEVLTKKAGEDSAYLWHSEGFGTFEIVDAIKENNGSEIKLYLKDDAKDYFETVYLRNIIKTYSDHINYPIFLDLGENGEEQVNSSSAIWAKSKAEVTEKQYKDFYQHITKNFDDPWLTLHFKVEGAQEYSGLLYVPSTRPVNLFQPDNKRGLKLYVNKVFISDKVEGLIPNYLRFVDGVIDSSDLPLNISREMLQENVLLDKIKSSVTNRILKELEKKSNDKEAYKLFWNNFGTAFKEGLYEDVVNKETIAKLSRFYSTNSKDEFTSLDEYISRAGDKKEIYFTSGENKEILFNNPQLEIFKANNIEVLLFSDPIDEFWIQTFSSYKGYVFKNIFNANLDLNIARDAKKVEDAKLKELCEKLLEFYNGEVLEVKATENLVTSPALIRANNGQMSLYLERLMKANGQQMMFESSRVLEINPYHNLIIKMSDNLNGDNFNSQAKIILDLAKIAEGEPIKNGSEFISLVANAF